MPRLEIFQDKDSDIVLTQDADMMLLSPEQAVALAHRLMSFGAGQGPRETETIDEKGNIKSIHGAIINGK